MSALVDLDETEGCPRADACEGCGTTRLLLVTTATTPVGVHCLTVCSACSLQTSLTTSLVSAVTRAMDHCAHLGITADDMADAMHAESRL